MFSIILTLYLYSLLVTLTCLLFNIYLPINQNVSSMTSGTLLVYFGWPRGNKAIIFPGDLVDKESAHSVGDLGLTLGQEDPLEKEMETHSSILAWRIPWVSLVGYSPLGHKVSDMAK